jgi:SAM-dependent methyltransferase
MKLTKISNQFDIFLSDEKDDKKNKHVYLKGNKVYYRFMGRFYIPDHVYKLSPSFVKELNNLREKYALTVIDKEFNDLVIFGALETLKDKYTGHVKILDFGCGYGYAGGLIKSVFPDSALFGIDIRKPLERKLFNYYNDFTIKAIDISLPYSDNFFDIIVSFFVFHFYVSDSQIRELSRIIKPNGTLYINLINSADFDVLDRLNEAGFMIVEEAEIATNNNSGRGYFYCLTNS